MDKKIILATIALVAVVISALLMAPDNSTSTPDTLPWNISHPTPESTRVFGITLGKTTLDEVSELFKHETEAEISLFKPTTGEMSVEVFYEEVNFNGLKAKMVFTVAVPKEEIQGMFQRGLRMNSGGSGKHITLAADDLARVRSLPIHNLTYLPNVRLEEAIISKRFGIPSEKIKEKSGELTHWLYPNHGLDIAVSPKEKPVLQYLSPQDFALLRTPLLASGEIVK